jgi:hypothetical protein
MSIVSQPGQFVLSIGTSSLTCEATALTTRGVGVAEHLAASRLPATWALDPTTNLDLVVELKSADAAHEIAVMADRSWAGCHAPRHLVATELKRRILRAAAAGHAPRTLVLADGRLTQHVDLLVKHGITAVRTVARSQRSNETPGRPALLQR